MGQATHTRRCYGLPDPRALLLWLLSVLSVALAAPARADESAGVQREARQLFERGLSFARAGQLEAAVQAFERSNALVERPSVLQNLAVALESLGRHREALSHVQRSLELLPAGHAARQALEVMRTRLRTRVAHLTVSVEPAGAAVWVDDRPLAAPAEGVLLDPGDHALRVEHPGHQRSVRVLRLVAGTEHSERVVLPADAPVVVAAGPPPGIDVAPSAPTERRALARWAYAGLGVSLAAAGGATALYLVAGNTESDWRDRCRPGCSEARLANAQEQIDRLDRSAYALFGVSGALLVGAGTLWWLSRRGPLASTQVTLTPTGLALHGRF